MIILAGRFDRGVSYYTDCKLEMMVHFPEDEVKCKWCPFLRHYDNIDRDKCGVTDEILYSREFRGRRCPIQLPEDVGIME